MKNYMVIVEEVKRTIVTILANSEDEAVAELKQQHYDPNCPLGDMFSGDVVTKFNCHALGEVGEINTLLVNAGYRKVK